MSSEVNPMLQGKIIAMAGSLLHDLNEGVNVANGIIRECIKTKMEIVDSLAQATTNSGLNQAMGQTIQGFCGIAGGAAGIAGGVVGLYGTAGHLSDLNKLEKTPEVAAANAEKVAGMRVDLLREGQAPVAANPGEGTMTAAQKELRRDILAKEWGQYERIGGLLGQGVVPLTQGAGALGQAPYTSRAAIEQAESQKAQALSEITSSQMASTEGAAQNLQQFFGQTTNLAAQSLQWAVIMSQAH